jgi:Replication-relaxation
MLRFSNLTTARHRLSTLVRLGMPRRFRPHRETGFASWQCVLDPIGVAILNQETRDEKRWPPQARSDRQLALERCQRLGHITGASWFYVSLARRAREHGGELTEWLNEAETMTGFNHSAGWADIWSRCPHPDGAGTWAQDGRQMRLLLEYHTGTENLPALTGKLDGYQALTGAMAWNDQVCPVALFCFTSPRREQTSRRALAATREAPTLRIATVAINPRTLSPTGPTWLPLPARTGHEVLLIDLDDALTDPCHTYGRSMRASAARSPKTSGCTATTKATKTGEPPGEDHALLPAGLPPVRPRVGEAVPAVHVGEACSVPGAAPDWHFAR